MTEEEINKAIVEVCEICHSDKHGLLYKTNTGWVRDCPDYCNDLNAMHEAEKVLTRGTVHEIIHATNAYIKHLARILACIDTAFFQFTHATARQRAEAFLRTLGKWEEAK